MNPILTICMPCFGRPQRTIRAIECILNQDINNWEAYIIGDNCPDFQKLIDSGYINDAVKIARENGNNIIATNLALHTGGYGYKIRNIVKDLASGQFFMYVDNDDIILPNHFRTYLSEIENTDLDFVYYNCYVKQYDGLRNARLCFGGIGHSELIVKTSFLKKMPPHTDEYGHDWKMIENMINNGAKHKKGSSMEGTYRIMSLPDFREQGID